MDRIEAFREEIWSWYRDNRRELPWREDPTPYGVFVSEVMLQQTQVSRVRERWGRWLERFPGFYELAEAPVSEVLDEWQGMGYNRRALWLRDAAAVIVVEHGGELPRDPAELMKLKGVGTNTAGSIAAFAYNKPTVFIETNIRRVFLHHFFTCESELIGRRIAPSHPPVRAPRRSTTHRLRASDDPGAASGESALALISDQELMPLIEQALDREHPREWYYALMDYGSRLAKEIPNPNRRSRHYTRQSTFEGSLRQLRGEVLRRLLEGPMRTEDLSDDPRLPTVLAALEEEGFIKGEGGTYRLS